MSPRFKLRGTLTAILAIGIVLNFSFWFLLQNFNRLRQDSACSSTTRESSISSPLIKVSMLYGNSHPIYERALENHQRHAKRWGYSMKILRQDFVGGLWNKPAYLLSLVLQELEKPASVRAKWLMWVDADTIILNPAISLGIFLPPPDIPDIHMISSKDLVGLNAGVLFFHVHKWTVDFLTETLASSCHIPEEDARFTHWPEQEAMTRLLQRPANISKSEGVSYREGHVYMPREWINSYYNYDMERRKRGDMLVHFPGMKDDRWPAMAELLNVTERLPDLLEVPLQQTDYLEKTSLFWDRFRKARDMIKSTEEYIKRAPQGSPTSASAAAVTQLEVALQENADMPELLQQRIEELRVAVSEEL